MGVRLRPEVARRPIEQRIQDRPGRFCPPHYRYSPDVFKLLPEIEAETLYVIGGLYGNTCALEAIERLAARERGPVTLVFNGDFNWFNVDLAGFERIGRRVLQYHALRGNVETELAVDDGAAGCGCAYPESVTDDEVARSNAIEAGLRETARALPALRAQLGALPMCAVARVGSKRIGIVHGDPEWLAGWGFARESLDDPNREGWIKDCFLHAGVRVFASSHTCLPVCRRVATPGGDCAVINNGAAGMPNFTGTQYGLITRIAATSATDALYGVELEGVHIEALPVSYDQDAWLVEFLRNWPPGSPAHTSYWNRLVNGPAMSLATARPVTGAVQAKDPA